MFIRIGSQDRRGLSNIAVVVLLVVLSLTAAGLLWVYIGSFVNEAGLGPAFSCLEMQFNPTIRLQKACYNPKSGDIELRVLRMEDNLNLQNLYFTINPPEAKSKKLACGEDCLGCDILEEGRSINYYVDGNIGDVGGNIILRIFGCDVDEREIVACE